MEIVGLIFLWIGVGFSAIGILGLMRLPDIYTRLHASGKVSTVGLCSMLLGSAILMPSTALKLVALAIFALLTLPVSTHAIAAAAYRAGVPMRSTRDDLAGKLQLVETPELSSEASAA
ncbi:MAG: monovalent cation/H(+) antiporter subunit G [Burkholderiales bacterium]|nr:monovalent cation/H(+) antiporter subunit G [Anaerolineae bacterium]